MTVSIWTLLLFSIIFSLVISLIAYISFKYYERQLNRWKKTLSVGDEVMCNGIKGNITSINSDLTFDIKITTKNIYKSK